MESLRHVQGHTRSLLTPVNLPALYSKAERRKKGLGYGGYRDISADTTPAILVCCCIRQLEQSVMVNL